MNAGRKQKTFSLVGCFFLLCACGFANRDPKALEILDSIPVYEGATLISETQTTYPDSEPSVIREYQTEAPREEAMAFYQSELAKLGWSLQTAEAASPYTPAGILAEKDGWRLNVLFYSTGKFSLRLYFK